MDAPRSVKMAAPPMGVGRMAYHELGGTGGPSLEGAATWADGEDRLCPH